ncbi:MAG: lytic transglycosylase domain-containing protein [Magnetococcales bacterium]|nr:lytic transglycosylase domain-containing protein [Magnetococcales bacterium]MBF0115401.1 lytic transglycosylase domain-containing protein [Magnetococcales bacterium]
MAKGIYSFMDEEGVLHLTDRPNDPRYKPITATNRYVAGKRSASAAGSTSHWRVSPPYPTPTTPAALREHPYGEIVQMVARQHGLHSALIHSIIRAESNYDPLAVSAKGAVGLMQLMPETARQYGVHNSTDPATNIQGGVRFLADLLRQFNNNLELSLAAYNAGPSTVLRYGSTIPPYPETQQYVQRVLRFYQAYQRLM